MEGAVDFFLRNRKREGMTAGIVFLSELGRVDHDACRITSPRSDY